MLKYFFHFFQFPQFTQSVGMLVLHWIDKSLILISSWLIDGATQVQTEWGKTWKLKEGEEDWSEGIEARLRGKGFNRNKNMSSDVTKQKILLETGNFNLTSSLWGKHISDKNVYKWWFLEQQEHAEELISANKFQRHLTWLFSDTHFLYYSNFSSVETHTSAETDSFHCFRF